MRLSAIRKKEIRYLIQIAIMAACGLLGTATARAQQPLSITIHWDKVRVVSRTIPTLQVVVNPPLRPGDPLSAASYRAVKELGADYVRYVPWLPYPRLAVAELEPPTTQKTYWDFSLIDPMTKDFLSATEGHPTVMNFSTIPAWLFNTGKNVTYPADPNQVTWNYTQGTELRDTTGKGLGDYYGRLAGMSMAASPMRMESGAIPAITTSCLFGKCSMSPRANTPPLPSNTPPGTTQLSRGFTG
jgi:hypothetical protein